MTRIASLFVALLLLASSSSGQEGVRVYTLFDGTQIVGELVIDSGTHIMIRDPLTGNSWTIERAQITSESSDPDDVAALRDHAQESVRVYTLSDGTRVVGEVVIDSGSHIMVQDPVTGEKRTFERDLIVTVSDDAADVESARPDDARFDGDRYPHRVVITVSTILRDAAGRPRIELLWDTSHATDAVACYLLSGPGVLQTAASDDGRLFVLGLPASLISESLLVVDGEVDTSALAQSLDRPAQFVEQMNGWPLYGLFADGIVRYLEVAPRTDVGAIEFISSDTDNGRVWVCELRAGWVDAPEMSEPDLWVHALDPLYAEMEQKAVSARQMIRYAREIEESLAATVPVSCSRCGGDGALSPNQRAMFTFGEEREYQDKLRRAQAAVPSSGTYFYRVKIEVNCSTCTDGVKGYRRPSEEYANAARDHVALLRRAERLATSLVSRVRAEREELRTMHAENYSREAAIAELQAGVEGLLEWATLKREIDDSEKRLRGIHP